MKKEKLEFIGTLFNKKIYIEKLTKKEREMVYDFFAGKAFQLYEGDVLKENKGIVKRIIKKLKN